MSYEDRRRRNREEIIKQQQNTDHRRNFVAQDGSKVTYGCVHCTVNTFLKLIFQFKNAEDSQKDYLERFENAGNQTASNDKLPIDANASKPRRNKYGDVDVY